MKTQQLSGKELWFRRIAAGLAATVISAPTTGAAEESETVADEEDFIEEIVVTATYRETAEMDTPVSMGTVSGDLIEETGSLDFNDIMHLVVRVVVFRAERIRRCHQHTWRLRRERPG